MYAVLKRLFHDESGATAIEYGLIAALVSVASIGALGALGGSLDDMFTAVSGELDTAVSNMPNSAGSGSGTGTGTGTGTP